LFDDLPIVVDAVNASLAELGAGPIDADGYRDHYNRPVYRFYEILLGREVTAAEWERIDVTFHDVYRSRLDDAALAADAEAAIDAVRSAGSTQSLLSMWWHDELVVASGRYGIETHMLRIDGNRGSAGETKAEHLSKHLVALREERPALLPELCLVVGDSLDDAVAAKAAGVPCVLFDGGSHHRVELEAAGVPVADSLLHALEVGRLANR
jgi:phosphoglycolate phosphatase-like HAD superfamily hydrolase